MTLSQYNNRCNITNTEAAAFLVKLMKKYKLSRPSWLNLEYITKELGDVGSRVVYPTKGLFYPLRKNKSAAATAVADFTIAVLQCCRDLNNDVAKACVVMAMESLQYPYQEDTLIRVLRWAEKETSTCLL